MKRFFALLTSLALIFSLILSPRILFADTTFRGIDVSAWQGSIDFEAVKNSGVEVVYIRAAYGYTEDSYFEQNYTEAKNAGLLVGFYHYISPSSRSQAESLAQYFYSLIQGKSMDYPPAMDFESFPSVSNAEINAIATSYIETLESLTGVTPAVYSDDSNVANLWNASFAKYPLWIAEYGVSTPRTLGNWNTWMGFQYSESGTEPGMNGSSVDLDYFKASGRISSQVTQPTQPVSTYHTVYTTYLIQKGDTIFTIARSQGATVQQIIKANNLTNPSLLIYGHTLRIPHWVKKTDTTSNSTYRKTFTEYVVQAGDTLSSIAYSHGAHLEQVLRANPNITNPNLIYVGEVIRIPHWTKIS